MFFALLVLLLFAWAVHVRRIPRRPGARGELLLRYVLIGYCGIPMVIVALLFLVHPHEGAEVLGLEPDHPFGLFLGWAFGTGLANFNAIDQNTCCFNVIDVDTHPETGEVVRKCVRTMNTAVYDIPKESSHLYSLEQIATRLQKKANA